MNKRSETGTASQVGENYEQETDSNCGVDGSSTIGSSYTSESSYTDDSYISSSVSSSSSVGPPTAADVFGKQGYLNCSSLSEVSLRQMQEQVKSSSDASTTFTPSSNYSVSQTSAHASPEFEVDPTHLPSVGSALHAENKCQPCLFVSCDVGCYQEKRCTYCHFSHGSQKKTRQLKAKWERGLRLVQASSGADRQGIAKSESTVCSI